MSLGSFATALLLPPINLVPIALGGLALARLRPRLGRTITAAALLALFALSIPAVSMTMIDTLQRGLPRGVPPPMRQRAEHTDTSPVEIPPGAIVILSADSSSGRPGGILPQPGMGMMTLERVHAGAILARSLNLPVLVTGGAQSPGETPIALIMALALQQDFAVAAAWIEPAAQDTWQNAEFSARLLRAGGVRRVYLVTNAWHMRRGLIAFRHFGIDAVPVASRFVPAMRWELEEFIPRLSAWVNSYYAVHEWIGCVWYELRAWNDRRG